MRGRLRVSGDRAPVPAQVPLLELDLGSPEARASGARRMHRPRAARIGELQDWCAEQLLWIRRRAQEADSQASDELFVYQQAAKLIEEVGELHAELLASSRVQRSSKQDGWTRDRLESEVADVLLCVLILAETLHIDAGSAVASKIARIEARQTREARVDSRAS